ncbi:hypothetical protein TEQG_01309 [Trichophyton equinum CBS 127.97]|uniref:Chloride channel protein n=1 Tax=Trichophyton equinum (strain ATCC MYA-4606 / CBS 127.97) TaxID=559882 RepID=F2PK51_TRIEC|nr:hypothetical protein TEQG_01309 [Trichophyton equinum CBS 127.97]
MNPRHRSSSSSAGPRSQNRPSNPPIPSNLQARRASSYSLPTHDHAQTAGGAATSTGVDARQTSITEEISEIKRYEDFTTIDWVQDAVQEQARRRIWRTAGARFWDQEGAYGWRRKLDEAYDAGQAWLVMTIVGVAIGLNAGFLNIVTEWLADVKLGYCTTGFYLNEAFCCWGADDGCPEWKRWSTFSLINYFVYFIFAIFFAFCSAKLVNAFAPYAAGSGISEIKVIIAGFIMKGFLGARTLVIKSLALPLSIGSGLAIGKEGPSVHFAVCTGNVISRWFGKYKRNAAKTREILTVTSAAGVAVAFGSPIGGVLFSLEEMASYFPLKTLWRSYFCALVATGVLAIINPFRTGQLVMFQVQYDRSWHSFEIIFFIILGVFGGLYGAFVMKWNLRAQAFRKKYLSKHPIIEATALAGLTALICYPNMFLRINMTEMMEILFRECEGPHDYNGICQAKNRWSMVLSLLGATVLRIFFVIISYGCKVPAGIFVPSMAIGASFGRMVGILVQALHQRFPDSQFFASCEPDVPCITPGTYALLGAGAALSGIMHLTISVTVIMYELTGALTYILPTMIVVGVTKAVSNHCGKGGIADRMIWFNGFPFLDSKEEHIFNVPVSHAMTSNPVVFTEAGLSINKAEQMLQKHKFQGFPIVQDLDSMALVGYIGRTELQFAIRRAKREGLLAPNARCQFVRQQSSTSGGPASSSPSNDLFGPSAASSSSHLESEWRTGAAPVTFDDIASSSGIRVIDMNPYVDMAPITVHPRLALETVMEIFKKMGPRAILVEHRGHLSGLVTVKDCLKYQFKVEHQEHADANAATVGDATAGIHAGPEEGIVEKKAWQLILLATGLAKKIFIRKGTASGTGGYTQVSQEEQRRHESVEIIDGTEDVDTHFELEERDH